MSATDSAPEQEQKATRKHIRGSSVLLAGRFISLGLNFFVNILVVRYLTKADYGAYSYALVIASMGSSLSLWSMDKAISRFLPIYDERGQDASLRGAIVVSFFSIIGVGMALILGVYALQGIISGTIINDPLTVTLLLIVIFFSPLDAMDSWFHGMFAVFASPKAIFFRRYIIGPGLKLTVILLVIASKSSVQVLAVGYVLGTLIGILAYGGMLVSVMRKKNIFGEGKWKQLKFPLRDIWGFATPLMYSDVVFILRNNVVIMLIGFFHDSVAVAEYRAVVPFARLNEIVLQSFTYLYTPLAARLFAKQEKEGINDLYWQTALWITVFSFPVFICTFALAEPLTVLAFQERYASSGIILALLSLGYYFNAALGFNNYTLRVYGVIRYIMLIDFIAAVFAVTLSMVLIPAYGSLGGALSASGTLIFHNILNHIGLYLHTDIQLFNIKYLRSYVIIIVCTLIVFAIQLIFNPSVFIGLPIAGLASFAVLRMNRKALKVADTFPELLRFKPLKLILGE